MMHGSLHDRFDVHRTEREARLEAVLAELERRFGPDVVYRLRDARPVLGERALPTGILSLDLATGIGGVPRGQITELIGPPSCGKSTLAFHLLAGAQHRGEFVTYIDTAHNLDAEQMQRCCVRLPDLLLAVPHTLHEALDIAGLLVESGGLGCLVLGPPLGSSGWPAGEIARLHALLPPRTSAVVFLSEEGAQRPNRALRHFAALRIALEPCAPLRHASGDLLGLRVRATIVKNKVAAPGKETELELHRDRGIHREADLFALGCAAGVVRTELLGLRFDTHLLGRGPQQACATLTQDAALAAALELEIRRVLA